MRLWLRSESTAEMVIQMKSIKCYSELITIPTFIERFRYLKLDGVVGEDTFGYARYLNQRFYQSTEWRNFRHGIIVRDLGCDLAIPGRDIYDRIILHHIVPLTEEDLLSGSDCLMNPENIICVSHLTHNALHYGDESLLFTELVERSKNDTCPWKN